MKCAVCIGVSWVVAAGLVLVANHWIEPISPALDGVAKIGVLVGVGFAYMRIMRESTLEHALVVGATWLSVAILVEVIRASMTSHGWFDLLGNPSHPVIHTILLIAWVGAPALFARSPSWIDTQ